MGQFVQTTEYRHFVHLGLGSSVALRLTLVDLDEICISNTNRQLSALRGCGCGSGCGSGSYSLAWSRQAYSGRYRGTCQGAALAD